MAISDGLRREITDEMREFGLTDEDAEALFDALWNHFKEDL